MQTSNRLSNRELEVSRLVAKGHTDKEIAVLLGISVKTVTQHLGAAYVKLGLSKWGWGNVRVRLTLLVQSF